MDEVSYRLFRQKLGKEIFQTEKLLGQWGLALSGGIDSGVLCAIFSKRTKLRTYSIGIRDSLNEFKLATKIAKKFKTVHKNISISKKEYEKLCKELISFKNYPVQVPNEVLLYRIALEFSKDVKGRPSTLFIGEGADELFGGYTNILNSIPSMPGDLIKNYVDRIVYDKELWASLTKKEKEKYYKIFRDNDIEGSNYDRVQNWIKRLHYPALLQRARSMNYANNISVVFPYRDRVFVYFSEALPRTMRVNKTFLRVCFGELLPRETMEQEKIGFPLPIDLMKWQKWNLDIYKTGKSKIDFWK